MGSKRQEEGSACPLDSFPALRVPEANCRLLGVPGEGAGEAAGCIIGPRLLISSLPAAIRTQEYSVVGQIVSRVYE